ncbi:MAG: DUF2065 family protein [Pseudomonadota bacterium]
MDLLAALGLVLVIEGLALAIFASSIPELLATIHVMEPATLRRVGAVMAAIGALGYILVRGMA